MPISTHGTGECSVALSPLQTDATLLANNSQHCWMLYVRPFANPVASCCVLLGVVAQFETGQTLQLLILLSCCVRLCVALPFFTYSNIPANF